MVTRFRFRLHEVGPTVYGGLIAWPFERAQEILRAYRAITIGAPRELAVWLVLIHAPPAPFVPEKWHGEKLCAMAVCYSGDLAEAAEVLAPIRALRDPVVDLLDEQPYTAVQSLLDGTEPKGMHYYWKTEYAAEVTDDVLSAFQELFASCPIPGAELGILHPGGAINEREEDDGAVGNRDARYVLGVLGMWEPDEPKGEDFERWVETPVRGCGRSPRAGPTSTSRPPTKGTSGSGRPTAPTSIGSSRSSGSTTRTTCSNGGRGRA